jgi:hypothetical protein
MPIEQRYFYSRKYTAESYPRHLIYAETNFEIGSRQVNPAAPAGVLVCSIHSPEDIAG